MEPYIPLASSVLVETVATDPASGFWNWPRAPENPELLRDDVHIWCARLDLPPAERDGLLATLSPDERARAARFAFLEDRNHFITARGILRNILSRYVGLPPSDLKFGYGAYGKPVLERECGGKAVHFNLSHAGGLALYALAGSGEIGIDHERIQAGLLYEALADQFLREEEATALPTLAPEAQCGAFFSLWTRMEACLKACGLGLAQGVNSFRRLSAPDANGIAGWLFYPIKPAPDFIGSVAVSKKVRHQIFWRWEAPSISNWDWRSQRPLKPDLWLVGKLQKLEA